MIAKRTDVSRVTNCVTIQEGFIPCGSTPEAEPAWEIQLESCILTEISDKSGTS